MADLNQDDIRALDMVSSGQLSPENTEAMKTKLGLDDDDLRAWKISKTHKDPNTRKTIQTEVVGKLQRTKESGQIEGLPGGLRATVQGAAQGATFGFSDEILAGAKAGWEKISKGGDIGKIYDQKVKAERNELKQLESKYPLQFIAGEIAGAIAVPIPGATAFKATKLGAKVATKGAQLLGEAALTSAGKAEGEIGSAKFLKEIAKGTTIGAGSGFLFGKGTKLAGRMAKAGEQPVKRASQFVSTVLFDLPMSYTEKLMNPRTAQKILNPKSSNEIVESIVDMTRKLKDHATGLSIKATDKLNSKKTIRINNVLKEINNIPAVKELSRSNMPEAQAAKKAVENAVSDLTERGKKFVSEVEIKRFIQDIDREIPWNNLEWKRKDDVMAAIRSTLDHKILKKNEAYKQAMITVDILTRKGKEISKSFALKREKFQEVPSDTTYSKVKGFFDVTGASKKPVTEEALKKAEDFFLGPLKPTILEDIDVAQIARRTEGGQAAGSRNILQGLTVGTLGGFPLAGAVAGAVKDKYGRRIGKSLLPKVSGAINVTDEALTTALDKIPADQLERVLRTLGRIKGAQSGVESVSQPTLLP
jgi:hypothetical protein